MMKKLTNLTPEEIREFLEITNKSFLIQIDKMSPQRRQENIEIALRRFINFSKTKGPRNGDIVKYPDGTELRFTKNWGGVIQTVSRKYGGSFYISEDEVSYSGGFEPAFSINLLQRIPGHELASFWFFKNNVWKMHNGIDINLPVRVYKIKENTECIA